MGLLCSSACNQGTALSPTPRAGLAVLIDPGMEVHPHMAIFGAGSGSAATQWPNAALQPQLAGASPWFETWHKRCNCITRRECYRFPGQAPS